MALTPDLTTLSIYCDGGARGNPGPAASAFVVIAQNQVIHQAGQSLGATTNNVAEYTAVLLAMQWLSEKVRAENWNLHTVNFYLDSNLVVNQITGKFKIKHPNLQRLHQQVSHLLAGLSLSINFAYIPRSRNYLADALVNRTLDSSR